MNDLFDLPQIDEDGYFCGMCTCMNDPSTGEPLIPPDVINTQPPTDNDKYWYKWDGISWFKQAKPTTCKECVEFGKVSHESQTMRCIELRELFQKLVGKDQEHYTVSFDENKDWLVEALPEKTQEELEEEQKQAKILDLKKKLAETDYVVTKIAEGVATKEDYADILTQREEWRKEIRELQGEE